MAVQTEGDRLNDILKFEDGIEKYMSRKVETVVGISTDIPIGTVVGKITETTPTTGTPGTNTGGGTMTGVTAGSKAETGTYTAKCAELGTTRLSATTGTPGSNTGAGTVTAVTAGASAIIGTYTISCDDIAAVLAATPATAHAFAGNTGSGAMGTITVSSNAKVGNYVLRINALEGNKGHFTVLYPDGSFCAEGNVGSAFSAGGLSFTLADATDYIIGDGFYITVDEATAGTGSTWTVKNPLGEKLADKAVTGTPYTSAQLNFTVNDSGTNFIVGDSFTVAVTEAAAGAGAKWDIKTPNGEKLAYQALTGTGYTSDHINFTINDSGANFAVADTFTVAVAAGSLKVQALTLAAVDGSQNAYGILITPILANAQRTVAYTSGGTYQVRPGDVVIGATSAATARVASLTLTSGTWAGGTAAGVMTLDDQVGTFQSEALKIDATLTDVATIGGNSSAYYPDRSGSVLVRDAIIDSDNLVWPTGITNAQIAAALAQLELKGIVARTVG